MPQNLFKIYDGRNYFWQWDVDQKLIVLDDTVDEVYFSNRDMVHAIVKEVCTDKDGLRVCNVPDALLTLPKNLVASAQIVDDDGISRLRSVKFAVRQRPIPIDYVASEDFQYSDFTERLEIIEEIIEDSCLVQVFNTVEEAEAWAQSSKEAGAVISVKVGDIWKPHVVEQDYSIVPICDCDEAALIRDIEALQQLVGDTPVMKQITNAIADLKLDETYEFKGLAAQALVDAKKYTDSKAKNYDAAGAADTVQQNLNEEVARAKKEEAAINKSVQQVNNAATTLQTDLNKLQSFVGEIPKGSSADTVIKYVDEKTKSIASSETIVALGERLDVLEDNAIQSIEAGVGLKATKTQSNVVIELDEDIVWVLDCGTSTDVI